MIEPVRIYTTLNRDEFMKFKHVAHTQRRTISGLLRWAVAEIIDAREWDAELLIELRREFPDVPENYLQNPVFDAEY